MYPNGAASKSNAAPFIQLENMPAFEKICEAAGGYGERVEDPAELPNALARALAVIQNEKRHALLNVMCG
jgi:acetolactate synthase I/II/III large subunit